MNPRTLMLILLTAIFPAMAAGDSVYKWTDDDGVTHFGDRQPSGKPSEKVSVRSGTSSASDSRPTPQEQLQKLQERQQGKQQQREESAVEEARRKQREANCTTARSNLQMINSNARIRVQENGESRVLSEEEIEEKRIQFEQFAEENCGPAEVPQAEQ